MSQLEMRIPFHSHTYLYIQPINYFDYAISLIINAKKRFNIQRIRNNVVCLLATDQRQIFRTCVTRWAFINRPKDSKKAYRFAETFFVPSRLTSHLCEKKYRTSTIAELFEKFSKTFAASRNEQTPALLLRVPSSFWFSHRIEHTRLDTFRMGSPIKFSLRQGGAISPLCV